MSFRRSRPKGKVLRIRPSILSLQAYAGFQWKVLGTAWDCGPTLLLRRCSMIARSRTDSSSLMTPAGFQAMPDVVLPQFNLGLRP
jgi:hypothetical protein